MKLKVLFATLAFMGMICTVSAQNTNTKTEKSKTCTVDNKKCDKTNKTETASCTKKSNCDKAESKDAKSTCTKKKNCDKK